MSSGFHNTCSATTINKEQFRYKFVLISKTGATRLQMSSLWEKSSPNNRDILIEIKKGFLLKTNNAGAENSLKILMESGVLSYKKGTRSEASYSVVISGLELELTDEDIATCLRNCQYKFRYCKRIISKATNKKTKLVRVITGDERTFESMLTSKYFFFMNRLYPIEVSRPKNPKRQSSSCDDNCDNSSSPIPSRCRNDNAGYSKDFHTTDTKRLTDPIGYGCSPIVRNRFNKKTTSDLYSSRTSAVQTSKRLNFYDIMKNPLSLSTDDNHEMKEVIEDVIYPEENENLEAIPVEDDKNALAAFKTSAQGMMDIALLTSNANQLRYLTMLNQKSAFYTLLIILISMSLFLQVAVGICLIFRAMGEYKNQSESTAGRNMSIFGTCAVYGITIINVFIASFTDIPTPIA